MAREGGVTMGLRRFILLSATLLFSGGAGISAVAQDTPLQVIDFVDLPGELKRISERLELDTTLYLEFRESWIIMPGRSILVKYVEDYTPRVPDYPYASTDSLSMWLAILFGQLPDERRGKEIKDITYEFMLLDPHLPQSGNRAFPEPDSMDVWTRELQTVLIDLIRAQLPIGDQYDLPNQMLSVYFHEDWSIDPVSLRITKKVHGITPVIWQRRQTLTGEPVNDGLTGLPVYYKNVLSRIPLRNP